MFQIHLKCYKNSIQVCKDLENEQIPKLNLFELITPKPKNFIQEKFGDSYLVIKSVYILYDFLSIFRHFNPFSFSFRFFFPPTKCFSICNSLTIYL